MTEAFKKIAGLVTALALLGGVLAGCTAQTGPEEQLPEIDQEHQEVEYYTADSVFSLNCDPAGSFNPINTDNSDNYLCTQLMYDTIFEVDSSYNVSTRIIREYRSDDGRNWYFYVDNNVKFWDGTSLTAQDVAYSLRQAMGSKRFGERLSIVQGVSAVDEELLLVSTYRVNMQLPARMTVPVIKNNSIEEFVPGGTGPYMPDEALSVLTAFNGNGRTHSIDAVYLKNISGIEAGITAFESSLLDLVLNDPSSVTNLGYGTANDIRSYPTTNMHYLGFNSTSRYFSNTGFRKALHYVINRDEIVSDALKSAATAAALPMNPACSLYNDSYSSLLSYSLRKGAEAFDDAEIQDYDDDGLREMMITGIPVEIDIDFIVCADNAQKASAARLIANNLKDQGIKVNLRELGWSDYIAALNDGDFDMYYGEVMLTADFDPTELILDGYSLNYGEFDLDILEDSVEDYLSAGETDRKKAADLMFRAIVENAPIVPVCFEKHQVVTHRGVIVGMKPGQYNIFQNIEEWTVEFD